MFAKPFILIVEDEPEIADFLKIGLSYEGYEVSVAKDGKTGIEQIRKGKVDLVILDIMLPDIDGFEVCRKIRRMGMSIPILMLTAKKDIPDRIKGLDAGADDYLTKPFSFFELLARIRALFRRSRRKFESSKLLAANIVLDRDTREVFVNGRPIYLTPTEFSLLELFMKHPYRVFTRETLLNRIWGYEYAGNTNIVDVHISHLREKIGDKPPNLIRTHYGVGYAFHPEERR